MYNFSLSSIFILSLFISVSVYFLAIAAVFFKDDGCLKALHSGVWFCFLFFLSRHQVLSGLLGFKSEGRWWELGLVGKTDILGVPN